MADDQHLGLGVTLKAYRQVVQVLPTRRKQLVRVEGEEQARLEGDDDPLPPPPGRRARDALGALLPPLLLLPTDPRSGGPTHPPSDTAAPRRSSDSLA